MEPRIFILEDADQLDRLAQFIGRQGKQLPLEVTVKNYVPKRSNPQNSRLWKLHALAAAETGDTAEDMHEMALCRFFGYTEHKRLDGTIKRVPLKRSSQRDKEEFGKLMEQTEIFYATELGVWLQ
jgi:hypothetical protein